MKTDINFFAHLYSDTGAVNRFISWLLDDNVIQCTKQPNAVVYRTQCSQYRKAFSSDELIAYYMKEYESI